MHSHTHTCSLFQDGPNLFHTWHPVVIIHAVTAAALSSGSLHSLTHTCALFQNGCDLPRIDVLQPFSLCILQQSTKKTGRRIKGKREGKIKSSRIDMLTPAIHASHPTMKPSQNKENTRRTNNSNKCQKQKRSESTNEWMHKYSEDK